MQFLLLLLLSTEEHIYNTGSQAIAMTLSIDFVKDRRETVSTIYLFDNTIKVNAKDKKSPIQTPILRLIFLSIRNILGR